MRYRIAFECIAAAAASFLPNPIARCCLLSHSPNSSRSNQRVPLSIGARGWYANMSTGTFKGYVSTESFKGYELAAGRADRG